MNDDEDVAKDVMELCLHTEICKQFGLSFNEIMELDYATYSEIRSMVLKEAERKHQVVEKTEKDLQSKQDKLLAATTKR